MLTVGLGAGFASAWSGDPGAVTRYAVRLSQPAIVSATDGADIEYSSRIESLDPATRTGIVIVDARSGFMWADFLFVARDQIINQASNVRYINRSRLILAHIPGIKVGTGLQAHG